MLRLFVPCVFLLFFLTACNDDSVTGTGDIVTKNIDLQNFNELEISGNFNVILVKKDTAGLSITTEENLHQEIEINQEGDQLIIEAKKNLRSDHGVEIVIGYKDLSVIEAGGASTIKSQGTLQTDNLTISMAGAGALKMQMEVDQLTLNIAGAGSAQLSGKVREQAIQLNGAGGLDAKDLISEYTRIDISGVGGADVYVTKKLDASVSGVGGVSYSGNPEEVRKDVKGLGSISKD